MDPSLLHRLDGLAVNASLADGTPCRTIGSAELIRLADHAGVSGRLLEIAALKQDILPDRYLRNAQTLSVANQIQLLESTVGIVGLGGLGGLVTETLARMGVGRLTLVDGDVFEAHNLNRQLLSSIDRIGMLKAQAAANHVKAINPGIEVAASDVFLERESADALVHPCDLVMDCLDNIPSRFILEAAARRADIPMVSTAVAGISGHVTTIFPDDIGLENIYGPEEQLSGTKGAEMRLGCLAPGVNLMASLACAEALQILLKKGNTLKNTLLVVDLADYTFERLQLA
jgi:molybdopterin/thiamine biosynthesis adenylyltransferase